MIGTSEFRLPVAVVCDGDAHSYQLAVLCDDGGLASDVYENYVHIPNVLAHRGWSHVRITSREWHRDREAAISRIRAGLLS